MKKQIKLHIEINSLVNNTPSSITRECVKKIISVNYDARNYFFYKTNEKWLDWLWKNGFLDVIKEKAKDPTKYSYSVPELHYLVRMAEVVPDEVANIITQVGISEKSFNPEVIDQFLRICTVLPAKDLTKIILKIHSEKWPVLMGSFNQWSFSYKDILDNLKKADDYENLILLSEALLEVRSKIEITSKKNKFNSDDPFYLKDLDEINIFKILSSVDNKYLEDAFRVVIKTLSSIILLGDENNKNQRAFRFNDLYSMLDVDIFELEVNDAVYSTRDVVKNLVATAKILADRLFTDKSGDKRFINKVYINYLQSMPDSLLTWRFILFCLSLCPKALIKEVKKYAFRVFDQFEFYNELAMGAEYEKFLKASFGVLDDKVRRDYTSRGIKNFSSKSKNQRGNEFKKITGSRILSLINKYLTVEEKESAKKAGFEIDKKIKPRPSIRPIEGGFVKERSPISQEEFAKLKLAQISDRLKTEWTPENLREKYKTDNFLSPRNAEGVGSALKGDIAARAQEYVNNSAFFYDPKKINSHYTYSFARGITEFIQNNASQAIKINWGKYLELLIKICDAEFPKDKKREFSANDTWLANWQAVYSAIADSMQALLQEKDGNVTLDVSKHRKMLLFILEYLLSYPNPDHKDEVLETASSTSKAPDDPAPLISDPFTMAINSVRGKAFQAFVFFTYQDGKRFPNNSKSKIGNDVKKIYEKVLRSEKTRAIMFLFGHYLPSFYFRDREWVINLLPLIFPSNDLNKYRFVAAWEGYLSNNLFEEMFFDPEIQKLYLRGIKQKDFILLNQKHFRSPDEGIAVHLALACIWYEKFDLQNPLMLDFLKNGKTSQLAEFVSFIGRSLISSDNNNLDDAKKKNPRIKTILADLWSFLLENRNESEVFSEFGTWINVAKELFEGKWLAGKLLQTLRKTGGLLEWDLGFIQSITKLAKIDPKTSIGLLRLFLFEGWVKKSSKNYFGHIDQEFLEAFNVLYKNKETQKETYKLIDDLMRKGGRPFWILKEAVKDK